MTPTYPVLPSTVRKRGKSAMPPDGLLIRYEVIDEVRAFQNRKKDKVLLMQLMKLDDGRYEVRVGYYIVGKLPKMRGNWVWGQFAAFLPLPVFRRLVDRATKKGWFDRTSRARLARKGRTRHRER